ncbi:tRNA (guanosine(46)-N7)-methyltransferase TrmB [Acidaminobacter sp. JC074]|uniref:tRNA (guanosine(46)-N7)-methyltransferase TrmB n=1 Tax=Acidaminobacter sp. JC074 TaxID=2530199 RepID=UPI001F102DFB|nr:tRNA (guanosine(46)-N7)-methyltransferase TrmB [Acidaminobacter sp. JC074]MCH4887260.1 tRNA (guanosine(46)-N7)-methyltransferase TrmB [Acidaminobacter sp. JC074]
MRLRYVENAHQLIEDHPRLLSKPEQYKDSWQSLFNKEQPLYVEFGAGKGSFIINLAKQTPEANLLAFERNAKVVFKSIVKLEEESHDNFFIVCADVTNLKEIFPDHSVDRIYLNFSDPWPKDRHAKRRLTHRGFLEKYKEILKTGGEIHFKTDNDDLFAFSVEEFKENGWELLVVTTDLHNSEFVVGNVMTEYEEKFSSRGKNINKLIARYKG